MSPVDVIVPVHDPARPVDRPVRSVLANRDVQVTVVAHNCGAAPIEANLAEFAADPRVQVIGYNDGIGSPAGPMNHGVRQTRNQWVALIGSDDSLAPGALDAWRAQADQYQAEVVLAQRAFDGHFRESLRRRPFRRHRLDVVRDGVFYATAPLGLLSRAAINRAGAQMTEGLPTGEDLKFSLALHAQARGIEYGSRDAAYRVHSDQTDRATTTARPLRQLIASPADAASSAQFTELDARLKQAAAIAIVRVHVLAKLVPSVVEAAAEDELELLADCVHQLGGQRLERFGALSLREHELARAAGTGRREAIAAALASPVTRRSTWLTANPRQLLAAGSPLAWLSYRTIMARVPVRQ